MVPVQTGHHPALNWHRCLDSVVMWDMSICHTTSILWPCPVLSALWGHQHCAGMSSSQVLILPCLCHLPCPPSVPHQQDRGGDGGGSLPARPRPQEEANGRRASRVLSLEYRFQLF